MMQLRMLGTLQDIGYEDAYLHINEPDHKLFVEITKNDAANGKYHSKKIAVNYFDDVDMFEPEFCHQKQLILYYMNQIDSLSN